MTEDSGTDNGPPPRASSAVDAVQIEVADPGRRLPARADLWLLERLQTACALHAARGEITLRIVGDVEMAAAHLRHSGVPGTTDVLTFDLRATPAPDAPLDVDVLICADEAARQAAARGHPVEHEVLLYAVHALLHCLGEDDHDPAAADRMHAREDAILQSLGVGPTFAREPAPGTPGGAP